MKYKKTQLVNYRQQRDNLNILETCTFIDCDQYRTNCNGANIGGYQFLAFWWEILPPSVGDHHGSHDL